MLSKRLVCIVIAVLMLSMMGCTTLAERIPVTGKDQASGADFHLKNTRWRLVSYGKPGSEIPVTGESEVTLQFEEGSQAGGSGGCNTFGAQYDISDGKEISITDVVSTEMACREESLMELETEYLEALQAADSFEIFGDSLMIQYGNGQGVLNFSRVTSTMPNSVNL